MSSVMAMGSEVDTGTARRLLLALCASVLAHASILVLVRAQPPAEFVTSRPAILLASLQPLERESSSGAPEANVMTAAEPLADAASVAAAAPPADPPRVIESQPRVPPLAAAPSDVGAVIELPGRDLTYYPVAALDTPPRPLAPADLCYPEGASGEVTYVLLIDESGVVNEATLAAVRPEGLFTAAAVESCRGLKFSPAIKDGRAVRSRVRFVIGPSPT